MGTVSVLVLLVLYYVMLYDISVSFYMLYTTEIHIHLTLQNYDEDLYKI